MTRQLDTRLPPAYNTADYLITFTAKGLNPATSEYEPIDISALSIEFVVETRNGDEEWTGTVGDGVTRTGTDGEFTVWIPLATMQNLVAGEYEVGCRLSSLTLTTQILDGVLPVLDAP